MTGCSEASGNQFSYILQQQHKSLLASALRWVLLAPAQSSFTFWSSKRVKAAITPSTLGDVQRHWWLNGEYTAPVCLDLARVCRRWQFAPQRLFLRVFFTGRMYNNRHRGLGINQNHNGKISRCEGKQSRGGLLARHSVLALPLSV